MQNLVNYHTLLCLFAEQLTLPRFLVGFALPTVVYETTEQKLQAGDKMIVQDSSLTVGYSLYNSR